MRCALIIAWREYAENARTKGFWIGLFLLPIILFLCAQVPIWLHQKGTPVRYFVLLDQSGQFETAIDSGLERTHQKWVLEALREYARKNVSSPPDRSSPIAFLFEPTPQALDQFIKSGGKRFVLDRLQPHLRPGSPPFGEPRRPFQRVAMPAAIDEGEDLETVTSQLKPYLRGARHVPFEGAEVDLSVAILIPREVEKAIVRPQTSAGSYQAVLPRDQIQYWSMNASDPRLREEIERILNSEVRRREYQARGMEPAAVREVEQTYLPLTSLDPKKESGKEAVSKGDLMRRWAPSGFVYLLWLAIFVIIQMLLNNTIEEKSNRIIEVLLSSVTPAELMMGKLIGIAAIGLTMVGVWMATLFGILGWKSGSASEVAGTLLTLLSTSNLVPIFSLYFLLGYLLYAAGILSLGSVCNTLKDAQNYMALLTMIMMVPLLTMTFIPRDPNGVLARVLSWIPIYTPFTMMNRAGSDPPMIDLIGTLVMLVCATAAALWMAGKIFRIGILRTGQPPKLLEILSWIRKHDS